MSVTAPLRFKRLREDSLAPLRATKGAAGYDLYAAVEVCIEAGTTGKVPTGISLEVPPGTYGRIAERSSMALQTTLMVRAGVIDSDYRGEVAVIFTNLGDKACTLRKGQRVAQLVLEVCATPPLEEEQAEELSRTKRGKKGFGSTGAGLADK